MKSLVIMLVDNDESLDGIESAVRAADGHIRVLDWTTRVDIPDAYMDYTFRVDTTVNGDPEVRGRRSQDRLLYS